MKNVFDVGKFFYDLHTLKNPFDTFKIVLAKAYFETIKDKLCQNITEKFVKNILNNSKYFYPEERIFETKNIKDNEFFTYLHEQVKGKCQNINDDIKEKIQLEVESELFYNKDKQNIKGLQEYLKSDLFKERKNIILKRAYQKKLAELFYKNNLSENFIEPTFEDGKYELKDIYDGFLYNTKHIWIFGRKREGKTSISYKVLNDQPFKTLYYLEFDELIHESDAQNTIYNKLKEKLVKEKALSEEENIDFSDTLIIIDDFNKNALLGNFLDLLTKDKYLKNYNILIFASFSLERDISSNEKFILDKYDSNKIEKLEEKKLSNLLFLQVLCESKNIEEQYEFFQNNQSQMYSKAAFDNYIGDISKTEFDKRLEYKLYSSEELIDFFATNYLIQSILGEKNEQIDSFFSRRNISERVIYSLSKHEELYDIKIVAKKRLNKILTSENTKIFSKEINFKTLHCFYAYWLLFNIGEPKDFIYINIKDRTKEEKKIEAIQRINLIYLIKIYKSVYHEQKLRFYGQKFAFFKNKMFDDFDATNELFIKIDFSYSIIEDCDFSGLLLDKVDFSNSTIKNTKFDGCLLDNINFFNTTLEKITISTSNFSEISESFLKSFNSLKEITFEDVDLSEIDFRCEENDFPSCKSLKSLTRFNFKNCNLTDCIFNHDLSNVNFTGSNLTNVEFHNSTLSNNDFTDADLSYANIKNINITSIVFLNNTKGLDTTSLKEKLSKYKTQYKEVS